MRDYFHIEDFYIPEIIYSELINCHSNNLLRGHFGIDKTQEFIAQKYYWLTTRRNVKTYIKGYDLYLASKTICHKPYRNSQSLSVLTYCWKYLLMDFVTGLLLFANWKRINYDLVLVIVDHLTKMVWYKPVKVIINTPKLAEVILNVVMRYHGLPNSIISNRGAIFTSKFSFSLCLFLGIKKWLFTTFHL